MSKAIKPFSMIFSILCSLLLLITPSSHAADQPNDSWEANFQNPPLAYRPLQIIHGFDNILSSKYPNRALDHDFVAELIRDSSKESSPYPDLKQSLKAVLQEFQEDGLGGVVCNVSFRDYMRDENQWTLFQWGIQACKEVGLRVWIYDEEGYPSGSAGGLVLKKNASYEAQELILDPTSETKYQIRPSYEGTHASNNYHIARRYPNLIDREADQAFIQITHDAYAKIVGGEFGKMIEAFFTDEPSMMACNLGQIPEEARKNVPVHDPIDPSLQRLPAVPWVHDLPERFQEKYGYEILPKIESLFVGDRVEDQKIRTDFWSLVSELFETRYFGAIQEWCSKYAVASSGHILWEESLLYHPALNGNPLRNLQRMDIPGIDVLSSRPANAFGGYALTAALAASAAKLNGSRRVMTETSDFSERMAKSSASLEEMCATAGWQFALGITDFHLYYGRNRETYPRYCEYVGRLGALLTPAERITKVALYYPISDLWANYHPAGERLSLESQSETLRTIVRSFSEINSQLTREGIEYCLVDHNHLAQAVLDGKQFTIGKAKFDTLLLPAYGVIPQSAQSSIQKILDAGGTVIDSSKNAEWKDRLKSVDSVEVKSDQPGCLWSRFQREGKSIILFVNTTNQPWEGVVQKFSTGMISQWNFATGKIEKLDTTRIQGNQLSLKLNANESTALVWE